MRLNDPIYQLEHTAALVSKLYHGFYQRDCFTIVSLIREFVVLFRFQTFFVLNGKLNLRQIKKIQYPFAQQHIHEWGALKLTMVVE